jgi:hypothetical protein
VSEHAESNSNGMVPRDEWEQTDAHKASRYFCGKCGQEFDMPHDLYDHLDEVHPRKKVTRRDRG